MEERLLKLLDIEQLSSSKFADVIGVQRSSISHILSGRNKPSFDFLQKTLKAFPHLNADWLILGEGKMYESDDFTGSGNLFDQAISTVDESALNEAIADKKLTELTASELNSSIKSDTSIHEGTEKVDIPDEKSKTLLNKRLMKVILLYSDNSFDSYLPDS